MSRKRQRWQRYNFIGLGGLFAVLALAVTASAAAPDQARGITIPAALSLGGPYALLGLAGQPSAAVSTGGAYRLSAGWLAPATATPPQPSATSTPPSPTVPPTSTPAASPTQAGPTSTSSPTRLPNNCVASVPGHYLWPAPTDSLQRVFLPAVLRGTGDRAAGSLGPAAAPDLVTSFELCLSAADQRMALKVTVTNVGRAATDKAGFWVDAYLNPSAAPAGALPWDAACTAWPCFGATWRVSEILAPGASLVLLESGMTSEYSLWPAAAAAPIQALFVYADSYAEDDSPAGLVAEADELNNRSDLPTAGLAAGQSEPGGPAGAPNPPTRRHR